MENKFTEEDKEQFVEFLNRVAKNATFNLNTEEIILHFKSLAYMQQTLLPKISANVLEVIEVIDTKKED